MNKIVHIISKMVLGGVEVGALSLLLNRADANYYIVCVKGGDEKMLSDLDSESRRRVYLCGGYIDALFTLFKLSPNIIVTSLWSSHIAGILFSWFSKNIVRYHFAHNSNHKHLVDMLVTNLSIRLTTHLITDSNKTKEFIGKLNKKVYVAPMNISFCQHAASDFKNDLTFVFVGRFNKVKDIKRSIDFILYLHSKGLIATLDLYGRDDGELDYLSSYIIECGLSKFIKFKEAISPVKVEKVMRKYNFYLQTSIYEGMSISVFQALLNGLIPVVTSVGEIENYSTHNINAFHFNLKDEYKSYDEFIHLHKNGFNHFKVGSIMNIKEYPVFYKSFFNIFTKKNSGMY